ncbi:hypothetical protein FIBSPDRAFT_1055883 [Athelia psychrophila]|uniref:Uncharacterized protein n=1 Tax=Athelia psychrophila TaxID=1759441 RepID=A0A167T0A1_9AGAM|nr:hypothetical protein FIBSPDRAFT_1055883 [Fibularhizoctonia sp. CBS 109695]
MDDRRWRAPPEIRMHVHVRCHRFTLINFVVVIAGFLWPTSAHKSIWASNTAREGAGAAGTGVNAIEGVLHEEAPAAEEVDTHARLNLRLCDCGWMEQEGGSCKMRERMAEMLSKTWRRPPFTIRNPSIRAHIDARRCWRGCVERNAGYECRRVNGTGGCEASNAINLCLLAHHGSLVGYRMVSAQLRPMVAMFDAFQKSFHFSSS